MWDKDGDLKDEYIDEWMESRSSKIIVDLTNTNIGDMVIMRNGSVSTIERVLPKTKTSPTPTYYYEIPSQKSIRLLKVVGVDGQRIGFPYPSLYDVIKIIKNKK